LSIDVIGMLALGTGGVQNGIAMVDIPQDGVIIGFDWDMNAILDATLETIQAELSFIATNQLNTNDVRGRLTSISAACTVLTAVGGHVVAVQKWLGSFDLAVAGGERLFMHLNATAGVVSIVRCNIYFDASGTMRRSARRR